MLKLHESLCEVPVLSLRTGGRIGKAKRLIVNPNNLKIVGWYVDDKFSHSELILLADDVRDISNKGIIIDDHEVLSSPDELIRLKQILEIDYDLLDKKVVSEHGRKYGKISDYSIETKGLFVKKIYASQTIMKNFTGGNLSIDRTQIIEITDTKIIIADSIDKATVAARSASPAS